MDRVAGVGFLSVGVDQAGLVRSTGLYLLARRDGDGALAVLFVGQGRSVGPEARRSPAWSAARSLGMNELLFTLGVREGASLEAMRTRLVALLRPPLNALAEAGPVAARG